MRKNLPDLQAFFDEKGVSTEVYSMEIIMGLFGTVIPFDHLTSFYDCFIRKNWLFFDHLTLVLLRELKVDFMKLADGAEVIQFFKDLNLNKASAYCAS